MVRGLKFCIYVGEKLYYPRSENKGADHLRSYREAETAKLICGFVFAYANCWFSHAQAHMISWLVCIENVLLIHSIFKTFLQKFIFTFINLTVLIFYLSFNKSPSNPYQQFFPKKDFQKFSTIQFITFKVIGIFQKTSLKFPDENLLF